MAQRLQRFDFSSSSGGSRDSPDSTDLAFAPGFVTALEVEIPHGHAGLTGVQFYYGIAQIWPKNPFVWVKGRGVTRRKELDDPVPGGIGWQAFHYNEDPMYDHTWHVTVEIDELTTGSALLPAVLLLRQTGEGASVGGSGSGGTGGGITNPHPPPE